MHQIDGLAFVMLSPGARRHGCYLQQWGHTFHTAVLAAFTLSSRPHFGASVNKQVASSHGCRVIKAFFHRERLEEVAVAWRVNEAKNLRLEAYGVDAQPLSSSLSPHHVCGHRDLHCPEKRGSWNQKQHLSQKNLISG